MQAAMDMDKNVENVLEQSENAKNEFLQVLDEISRAQIQVLDNNPWEPDLKQKISDEILYALNMGHPEIWLVQLRWIISQYTGTNSKLVELVAKILDLPDSKLFDLTALDRLNLANLALWQDYVSGSVRWRIDTIKTSKTSEFSERKMDFTKSMKLWWARW